MVDHPEERKARETQISLQMEGLEEITTHLEKVVEELTTRLWSVLRNEETSPKINEDKEPETLAPLANNIRHQKERIHIAVTQCKRVIDLLEVS